MAVRGLFSYIFKKEKKKEIGSPIVTAEESVKYPSTQSTTVTSSTASVTSYTPTRSGGSGGTATQQPTEVSQQQRYAVSQQATQQPTEVSQQQRYAVSQQATQQPTESFYYTSKGFSRSKYRSGLGITYYEVTQQGKIIREIPPEEVKQYGLTPTNVLQAKTKEDKTTIKEAISEKISGAKTKIARGSAGIGTRVSLFGLGFASAGIEQIEGAKAILNPKTTIQTIASIPKAFIIEARNTATSVKMGYPELAGGRITSFYVGSKTIQLATKVPTKALDIYRTRATIEIPVESVIAPEYFKGQTYPAIAKGESAGQLLTEFKGTAPETYGVTQLKGFTASPKPFEKVTTTGVGSSEIAGVYQAPKLSPAFLRITKGEYPSFSLNPFETLRPSATIIKPSSFELTPIISKSQKYLASLTPTKQFFIKEAELGKSYVPFIKTEKEAIIPAGTPLTLTDKRFFFKFEGRRIPIYEFETGIGEKGLKEYTLKEVEEMSSRRVGKASYTSADVVKLSRSTATSYSKIDSSIMKSSIISSKTSSNIVQSKSTAKSTRSLISPSTIKGSQSYLSNYYKASPKSSPYTPYSPFKTTFSKILPSKTQFKSYKLPSGKVELFVKEKGRFVFRGAFSNVKEATASGVSRTQKSISRSFKIVGANAGIPRGYRRSRKKGFANVFVELPKTALSQFGEQFEIQTARKRRK